MTHPPALTEKAGATRLDSVLMTMDLVDTLRRKESSLKALLDEDAEHASLVVQVQEMYANQGIEVSPALVAEAVRALKDQRFTYTPPPRSWKTALAHLYIRRRTIGRRAAVVAAICLGLWTTGVAIHAIDQGLERRAQARQQAALETQADSLAVKMEELEGRAQSLMALPAYSGRLPIGREQWEKGRSLVALASQGLASLPLPSAKAQRQAMLIGSGDVRSAVEAGLATAAARLDEGGNLLAQTRRLADLEKERGVLSSLPLPAASTAAFPARLADFDASLAQAQVREASSIAADLHSLSTLTPVLAAAAARFAGWPSDARTEAEPIWSKIQAKVAQASAVSVKEGLVALNGVQARLDEAYTLDIVDRPGVRSGVERTSHDTGTLSYYLVVEATGVDGKSLDLPIKSMEDGQVKTVSRFALRVPLEVYNQVKADKMDNGLVDRRRVGEKRAGTMAPNYLLAVSGGAITSW